VPTFKPVIDADVCEGNLDQRHDPNPFVSEYKDKDKPHPSNGWDHLKSQGWDRKDII
jgi:ubiquinol oxidase